MISTHDLWHELLPYTTQVYKTNKIILPRIVTEDVKKK